jgi:hypothetical protein
MKIKERKSITNSRDNVSAEYYEINKKDKSKIR